jgi:hypothetical protein
MIELWGKHYFQNLTQAEWDVQKHKQFVKVENVHTKKEMEAFVAEKMATDMEEIPMKLFFIPDFDETTGRLYLIINHAYSDAAGMFSLFIALTEE